MNNSPLILVAEDDQFLRKILMTKLQKEGFQAIEATNGEEALNLISELKPALVLLDLIMPVMTGFEVLEQLNRSGRTHDLMIVVLSNLGQDGDIEKAMAMGATDYLIKSNNSMTEIVSKTRKLLANIETPLAESQPITRIPLSSYQLYLKPNFGDYQSLLNDHPELNGGQCTICDEPLSLVLTPHQDGSYTAGFVCTKC